MKDRVHLIGVLLWSLSAGCSDILLEPVGTPDTDGTDTGSSNDDTGTDPAIAERIPMILPQDADPATLIVPGESNAVGIQGFWYTFTDENSPLAVSAVDPETVCIEGTIEAAVGTLTWGGLGFSLCYTDGDDSPPWEILSLSECPFSSGLAGRIIGASFEVTGELPQEGLFLHLKENGDLYPPYFPITAPAQRDYLFADAQLNDGDALNLNNVESLQFHVNNTTAAPIMIDFCIRSLTLLVLPE